MRSEIINALLVREAANERTKIEKQIGYEEEGCSSLFDPRLINVKNE